MAVISAQGTTFSISNSAAPGGTQVVIECIRSFTGMDGEASDIDITCLTSTAKEFRQGLQDFGKFSIDLFRDPEDLGQIQLDLAKAAGETRVFVLTLSDGQIATFSGYVKSLTAAGAVDGAVTGTANIKITGNVVWS